MYQTIEQLPQKTLENIQGIQESWKLILRDAGEEDFEKVPCSSEAKMPYTKENLISEISKLESFPDYTILPDSYGSIHVIHYGRQITNDEQKWMYDIFRDVFGIINYE